MYLQCEEKRGGYLLSKEVFLHAIRGLFRKKLNCLVERALKSRDVIGRGAERDANRISIALKMLLAN